MYVYVCAEENLLKCYSIIYFVNEMVEYTCVYSLCCTRILYTAIQWNQC